jgi:hypothetical protein
MKGNGNNMTEWYGIGKIGDPEAGYVLPSGWGEHRANWGFWVLYENAGQQSIDVYAMAFASRGS